MSNVALTTSHRFRQEDADRLHWFHSIDLGNGVVTKGKKSVSNLRLEADAVFRHGVKDQTVLDIGAWDGAFTFEAERRGATVTSTDYFCWVGPGWGKKACFDFARAALGSRAKDIICDVPDLRPSMGRFDVVLFLGVFYHLKNPLAALETIAPLARNMLIVETVVAMNETPEPAMRFYPGKELDGDPTNWWGPNIACLKAMLNLVGFPRLEVTPNPASPKRVIVHAWR